MRLIDADKLREVLQRLSYDDWNQGASTSWAEAYFEIADMINAIPTVEAEPIRHGKWIWDDEGYHCSECWYHPSGNTLECMDGTYKYCPSCGCKMDLDEVEK